jgi:hypothetical protein
MTSIAAQSLLSSEECRRWCPVMSDECAFVVSACEIHTKRSMRPSLCLCAVRVSYSRTLPRRMSPPLDQLLCVVCAQAAMSELEL